MATVGNRSADEAAVHLCSSPWPGPCEPGTSTGTGKALLELHP
jgi:hypothetical protein